MNLRTWWRQLSQWPGPVVRAVTDLHRPTGDEPTLQAAPSATSHGFPTSPAKPFTCWPKLSATSHPTAFMGRPPDNWQETSRDHIS